MRCKNLFGFNWNVRAKFNFNGITLEWVRIELVFYDVREIFENMLLELLCGMEVRGLVLSLGRTSVLEIRFPEGEERLHVVHVAEHEMCCICCFSRLYGESLWGLWGVICSCYVMKSGSGRAEG